MTRKQVKRSRAAKEKVRAAAVQDSAARALVATGDAYEAQEQVTIDIAARMRATERFIAKEKLGDLEHQAGKLLSLAEFESRILRITRGVNLFWQEHSLAPDNCEFLGLPLGTAVKSFNIILADGKLEFVKSYVASPFIAEFTLILTKKTRVPSLRQHLSAKDFPKARLVDGEWEFDGPTPLEAFVEEPWGKIPGWREVSLACLDKKICSLSEIEREFGSADRASWAQKTGKQDLGLGEI